MKKTLIALATLAATGAVMAQSSVTIYGVIDQAFTRTSNSNGGSSNTGLTSSANLTNRLGFRGTEDLGGGLSAKFQIETNLNADAPGATTLGDRGAWVSLASATMGEVRLGRDYNNAFWNPILFTAFGTNGVGQTIFHATRAAYHTTAGFTGTTHATDPYIWNNNSISYILPGNLGGVYGNIQHAFDEAAAPSSLGQSTNMRLGYKAGALDVAFGYGQVDGVTGAQEDVKSMNIGASYDFGVVKVLAVWNEDKLKDAGTGASVSKLKGYEIGAVMPVGPGNLRASYGTVKIDDLNAATADAKANKFAIGYVYPLSKRTSVYTTYARVSNKNGMSVLLTPKGTAGAATGFTSSGLDIGISHTF
ncbi:porin [Macromonas nakdongensis]|uniref:porin n=1 Tax=Macromonas nakdongensis TaxID=1843082 RepID=UPI0012FEEAB0|nr:porin [Macromonas nakdongensis]